MIKDKDKEQKIQNTKELLLVTKFHFRHVKLSKIVILQIHINLLYINYNWLFSIYSLLPLLTTVSVIVQQPIIKLAILDQLTE